MNDRRSCARSLAAGDRLGGFEKALDAFEADQFKRGLFGGEIVVKACLPDAEDVSDVLRGGAVEAALGENAGRRINNLRRAASLAGAAPGGRASTFICVLAQSAWEAPPK